MNTNIYSDITSVSDTDPFHFGLLDPDSGSNKINKNHKDIEFYTEKLHFCLTHIYN